MIVYQRHVTLSSLFCLLGILSTLTNASELPSSQENARSTEQFVIITGDYPPYISKQSPNFGPVSEIVKEACDRSSIKVEIKFYPWARVTVLLKKGLYPASYLWSKTPDREQEGFFFSDYAVSSAPTAVFFKKSAFPNGVRFDNYSDLIPYTIIGVEGYWYKDEFSNWKYKAHFTNRSELAWKMLSKNRYQLYVDGLHTGLIEAKRYTPEILPDLGYTTTAAEDPFSYIMFSPEHPQSRNLKSLLDPALKSMHEDGTFDRLIDNIVAF